MLLTWLTLLLGVVTILIIIAIGGFFVAQEFAYMSVDRSRLAARAADGDTPSKNALQITRRTSFMLSGAQLGITVTGLLVGYVAEPLIGDSLAELLGGTVIDPATSVAIATVSALLLATIVQMIFGELYPKNLAIAAPESLARALAVPTRVYLVLFGWLVAVFDWLANLLLKLLRIEPLEDIDSSATASDLEHIIEGSRSTGDLPEQLSVLMDRILDFPARDVEHAMMPRSRVDVVHRNTSLDELTTLMSEAHTRYPVVDDEGAPIGIVDLLDVLRCPDGATATAASLMQPPVLVPSTMPLPDALTRMRTSGTELVIVVDEYGNFDGILTTEDLTEEVAGELTDEHDPEELETISRIGPSRWQVSGDVHLDEIERLLALPLPHGDYETIAGLTIAAHGDLPVPGTRVRIPLPLLPSDHLEKTETARVLDVEVLRLENHVPALLVLELLNDEPEDDA